MNGGRHAFHGLVTRPGLPEEQMGYLFRADHHVSASHRLAHPPRSAGSMGIGCNGQLSPMEESTISAARRPCSSISIPRPGLTTATSATATQILHQLHCRTRAHQLWCLVQGRSFPGSTRTCGASRPPILARVIVVWGDRLPIGPLRRNPGALRLCRLAGLSSRGMFSCLVNDAENDYGDKLYDATGSDAFPAQSRLVWRRR